MQHFGPFGVVIAFFLFLTASAIAGIVADYKKRRVVVELIRTAIERGQPTDAALIERLLAPEARRQPLNPLYLRVGGIVTIAAGIGVGVLALFVNNVEPGAVYPISGGGAVAICVGIGLLLAARVAERQSSGSGARAA